MTATTNSLIINLLSKGSTLIHEKMGESWETNYSSPKEALWSLVEYGLDQKGKNEHIVISHMGDCLCIEYRDNTEEYVSPKTGKAYCETNYAQLIYIR